MWWENINIRETQCRDSLKQGEHTGGPRKSTRLSNSSSLTPTYYFPITTLDKSGPDDDTFDGYPVPKLLVDASRESCKHDGPTEFSPNNNFFPEKLEFHQSHKNTSFPKLFPDFNGECISQDSFYVGRRREDLSTDDGKFELKDDASNCCNNLSSENGKPMDANIVPPRNQKKELQKWWPKKHLVLDKMQKRHCHMRRSPINMRRY
ncbi:unnamed protein product [Ilex paraguariensis]|uniref:Uncharacterized protein n=1 Tax=Ilex paraguariensis TaxID=185542 RepID=A0ABC8TVM3_9AQUA